MKQPNHTRKIILLIMAFMAFMLVACTPDTPGSGNIPTDRPTEEPSDTAEEITMFVGPELVDCVGEAPQTCLQVKFAEGDEWQRLYSGIEGFEHEAGIQSELRVNKITVENPPADGSSIRYELIEIVSQSTEETAVMENLDLLLETEWDLVTMNGQAPLTNSQPTISFQEEVINGTTGCNSFFGGYTLNGTELTIEQVGQTEMACEGLMEQEQSYTMMLMSAVSLTLENNTLTIHTSEGDLVYQPAETAVLEGHTWHLSGIAMGQGENAAIIYTWIDERITAEFTDGQVSGNSGCNSYSASYELGKNALDSGTISLTPIVSTLVACQETEIMDREAEFAAAMQNIASYEIVRDNLTFFDADGNILITFASEVPEA